MKSDTDNAKIHGVLSGVSAYGLWGIAPIYFVAVKEIAPLEILCHRIVWSLLLLLAILAFKGAIAPTFSLLRERKTALVLFGSSLLISLNWLTFIYAVGSGHTVDASLGYFINPLLNVLIGMVVFGERLRRWQIFSLLLASAGVTYIVMEAGGLPWIAMVLAVSFALYGMIRKKAPVASLEGLTMETTFVTPIALGALFYWGWLGQGAFATNSLTMDLLLIAAGPVTAVPLLFFTKAARAIDFSLLGILQYLAPTLQFVVAVFLFDEPLDLDRLIGFVMIWAALVVFAIDEYRTHKRKGRLTPPSPVMQTT